VSPTARAAGVAAAVVAADQATKALVRAGMERGDSDPILPGLKLVNVRNTGVAFGFLSDGGALLAAITAVALAGLMVFFFLHRDRPLAWLPVGLLLGGAIGNLIDRLAEGAVTDFLKLPKWPAFNVADIAITFGVLALLYVLEGPPRRAEAD
jgi:signal peptidase II